MIFTVAVDGPAAAGKGTVSKRIAERFGFAHLDTGLLYRVVGSLTLQGAEPEAAARSLMAADLEREGLRTPEVAQAASRVAADPEVRRLLLDFQREFARREGGAVLDGRDIGTVICPEAEVKFYVTANDEARARRRYDELSAKGLGVTPEGVLQDLRARDARDASRDAAPMVPAKDAVVIDTSEMDAGAVAEMAFGIVSERLPVQGGPGSL